MNSARELLDRISKNTGKPVPGIFHLLGRGSNGVTFLTNNNPPKVLKIVLGNGTREINAIRKLQAAGASFIPRINANNFINIRKTNANNNLKKKLFPGFHRSPLNTPKTVNQKKTLTVYTMSKVGNKSLFSYVQGRTLTNNNKRNIRSELSRAIKFMHHHGISHGDLHSGNILVELDSAGKMKKLWVIDFGRAVTIPIHKTEKDVYNTMRKNNMYNNYKVLNMPHKTATQLWSGPAGLARQNHNMYRNMYGGNNANLKRFTTLLSASTRWTWRHPKK